MPEKSEDRIAVVVVVLWLSEESCARILLGCGSHLISFMAG